MKGAQPDRAAERLERSRLVRMRVNVAAHLLDEFRIAVDLDVPFRFAALAGTKARALGAGASAEEDDVLRPGTTRGTGGTTVHASGPHGVEKRSVHGAVASCHRVPVARSPELLFAVRHFGWNIHHCKRRHG